MRWFLLFLMLASPAFAASPECVPGSKRATICQFNAPSGPAMFYPAGTRPPLSPVPDLCVSRGPLVSRKSPDADWTVIYRPRLSGCILADGVPP